MRPDALILFYESLPNAGAGAVVAAGRIVDVVIAPKQEVPRDVARRLVVDDVDDFSNTNELLVTSFDNLFVFPKQVPFRALREMGAADASNLVSAQLISGKLVNDILDLGWDDD